MIDLELALKKEQFGPSECKGLYFRYTSSDYLSSYKSLEYRQSFRLLKRMSCKGCNLCAGFWEDVQMTGGIDDIVHWPSISELHNGSVYCVIFCPGARDYETGYVDDWWWELVPYKE